MYRGPDGQLQQYQMSSGGTSAVRLESANCPITGVIGAGGPAYVKDGGMVRYRLEDVEAWVLEHTVQPRGAEQP